MNLERFLVILDISQRFFNSSIKFNRFKSSNCQSASKNTNQERFTRIKKEIK